MAGETIVIPVNLHVRGQLVAASIVLPANCVGDTQVTANDPIGTEKLQHLHQPLYATGSAVTAAAATQALHTVSGLTATLVEFFAGSVVANIGDSTVTVDLKHNGTSVLTSPITLTSSNTARQVVSAVLNTTAFAVGDVLEIVVTVSAGTGTLAKGLFAGIVIKEDSP